MTNSPQHNKAEWPDYATVWRWHFYAGLFCIPFVLILSVTGTIYLFRPQIESWQDRKFDRLPKSETTALLSKQIVTAVSHLPNSVFLRCELPASLSRENTYAATRVIVSQNGESVRVLIDPAGPAVLDSAVESQRFIRVVRRIHGELLLGKRGSYLVETAASWTIFMIVSGSALWWPRKRGFAGVLYPRLNARGKVFWKDLHSVGGCWGSVVIVFLVATGLPWSTFWGDYFKWIRSATGTAAVTSHWEGGHQGHAVNSKAIAQSRRSWRSSPPDPASYRLDEIDSVARFARTTELRAPVMLLPPRNGDSVWQVKSETANRPYRQTIQFDASTGQVVGHERFSDRHWIDQVVGQGIALHEGQRFGFANQLIALLATIILVLLSCSGIVLWWRRRGATVLSPPAANRTVTPAIGRSRSLVVALVGMALAIYLPLFGATLLCVIVIDRCVVRRYAIVAQWLGWEVPSLMR